MSRSVIVGTAGHVDHGKTTLVRALTGIDTDRLEEEKRRGISIDLGFAHMQLTDSLRAAFIDVPGHEKFIRNMLAGVGGIDLVLLVVAADESVRPQTREHFDICKLLKISSGLIALTRCDVTDPDIVELVRMEVQDFVAGTFLENAPIIPVSAVTGEGLPALRAALTDLAARVPPRSTIRNFRLPVDRAFTMPGFGTVVTGTVLSGATEIESELEILPASRRARVRGLQVHGQAARRTSAGQRAAINLAGIELADASRGSVLVRPGCFRPTQAADCMLGLLDDARPLKNRAPVHFHAGTTETVAEVRALDGSATLTPSQSVPVRLVFRDPVLLVPTDRFIIRMFSPVTTIGGGEVVDPFPPAGLRLTKALDRTRTLAGADNAARIRYLVAESPGGISQPELIIRTGLTADALAKSVPVETAVLRESTVWYIDTAHARQLAAAWRDQLANFHRDNPLLPGISREDFRSRALPGVPAFVFDFILSQDASLRTTGEHLHLATHKLALKADEERALASIEQAFESAGLAVPALDDVLAGTGIDRTRARNLLQVLLRNKRLTRVTEDLVFHTAALDALRMQLTARKGTRFGVAEFKDWTGVSRKYAIPLLEYFDRERVTRRDGDARLVL